jgi:hypothetical protein
MKIYLLTGKLFFLDAGRQEHVGTPPTADKEFTSRHTAPAEYENVPISIYWFNPPCFSKLPTRKK